MVLEVKSIVRWLSAAKSPGGRIQARVEVQSHATARGTPAALADHHPRDAEEHPANYDDVRVQDGGG
jgi:hypothetical protein